MYMKTKKLVTSAMMISIATVLSLIQPFQLPFGGGITLASMMPIVLIGYNIWCSSRHILRYDLWLYTDASG